MHRYSEEASSISKKPFLGLEKGEKGGMDESCGRVGRLAVTLEISVKYELFENEDLQISP